MIKLSKSRNPVLTFLLFLSLLTVCISSYSHHSGIDSLHNLVKNQQGIDKVKTLINISRHYFINSDSLSIKFSKDAIEESRKIEYSEGVGMAMLFLGLSFPNSEIDSALKYYIKSSEILESLNHPWAHYGYKNAADIYTNRGWHPEALDYLLRLLEINQRSGDTLLISETMSTLGHIHANMENFQEAYSWQQRALKIAQNIDNNVHKGLIHGRIGIAFDEQGLYDSAFYYNLLAIDFFQKARAEEYLGQWKSNTAYTYIKQGNYRLAEKYLEEAINHKIGDNRKAIIFVNLGKVYIETNRLSLAEVMLDSACFYAQKYQQKTFLGYAWHRKYELNKAKGNIHKALEYFKKYADLRDTLLNVAKTEQVAQMLVRYQVEQKDKALLLEKAEKEKVEKEKFQAKLSASKAQKWLWGIAFVGILIVMYILLTMQRLKRSAHEEKHRAIIEEQEKSLIAIINAQEDERRRVAKDLHDGVGQQISAISLNFQALGKKIVGFVPDLSSEIGKIRKMIIDTSNDIRAVSHQMMPRALTEFGLVDAIEDMVETSFANSPFNYKFKHKNLEDRLLLNVEIGLYRIAQELISNTIKHSQAKNIEIRLERSNNQCNLTIKDDGEGFMTKNTLGIGIANIKSRVSALKGEFILESEPGKGTSATVRVYL